MTDAASRKKWAYKDLEQELKECRRDKDAARTLAAYQRAAADGLKLGAYHRVGECAALARMGFTVEAFVRLLLFRFEGPIHPSSESMLRSVLVTEFSAKHRSESESQSAATAEACLTALEASATAEASHTTQLAASILLEGMARPDTKCAQARAANMQHVFATWARLQLVGGIAVDTRCYNALLQACVVSRSAFKGKRVLRHMEAHAVPFDEETYEKQCALHLVSRPRETESAELAMAQCKAAGLEPSGSFYVHLINSRLRLKDFPKARELFDEMEAAGHTTRATFRQRVLRLTAADEPQVDEKAA